MTKVCTVCREQKPLDEFQPHIRGAQGRRGQCRVCRNVYEAEWRDKNREACRAAGRKYVANNREKQKNYNREFRTFFTPEVFAQRLAEQDNACAICHVDFETTDSMHIHADHEHRTGKSRGVLCRSCNLGLGYFNDSTILFERAIEYLKKYQK